MSTEIEVNKCFDIYDFSTENENFLLSQVLITVIKIFQCNILFFEMYIKSLNAECKFNHKTLFFYILFIQTKKNEHTKHAHNHTIQVSILHELLNILSISSLPRVHDTSVNFEIQKNSNVILRFEEN